MINKSLIALLASASFLGARVAAQNADNAVDFDQTTVAKPVVDARPQASAGAPKGFVKTYETSGGSGHQKGFRKHENAHPRDWKRLGEMEGSQKGSIPDTYDLRSQLTPIEDQGQCGSCWAFSLTATSRDGHAISGKDPGRLSQEWLVDVSTEALGCQGGDFDSADYLVGPGQPLWDACPYSLGKGNCPLIQATPATTIVAWHMLGDAVNGPSVRDIETAVAGSGKPVSIAIAAGAGDWERYSSGIYNGCTAGPLDHMINIVGWDNEGATFDANGNLPPGKGVWIMRNSWGPSWGEAGYMRTKMTDAAGVRCNEAAQQAAYFDF